MCVSFFLKSIPFEQKVACMCVCVFVRACVCMYFVFFYFVWQKDVFMVFGKLNLILPPAGFSSNATVTISQNISADKIYCVNITYSVLIVKQS